MGSQTVIAPYRCPISLRNGRHESGASCLRRDAVEADLDQSVGMTMTCILEGYVNSLCYSAQYTGPYCTMHQHRGDGNAIIQAPKRAHEGWRSRG